MKIALLVAFAVTALGANVFASTRADSWDVIMADKDLAWIGQGMFYDSFGPNGFFNACVSGDELHSIAPVSYCVSSHFLDYPGTGGGHMVCDQTAEKDVVLSLNQTVKAIVGYRSDIDWAPIYGNVNFVIPTVQSFSVYNYSRGGTTIYAKLYFTKDFTIPNCK
jgi:hypothetical protein